MADGGKEESVKRLMAVYFYAAGAKHSCFPLIGYKLGYTLLSLWHLFCLTLKQKRPKRIDWLCHELNGFCWEQLS
jgi:hypothetical protein